jgi:hypothetical protein
MRHSTRRSGTACVVLGLCALLTSCSSVSVTYRGPMRSDRPAPLSRTYPPGVAAPVTYFGADFAGRPAVFSLHNQGARTVDWVACDITYWGSGEFLHSMGEMTYASAKVRSAFVYCAPLAPGEKQQCVVLLQPLAPGRTIGMKGGVETGSVFSGTGNVSDGQYLGALPYFGSEEMLPDGRVSGEALARFRKMLHGAEDEAERLRLLGMLVSISQEANGDHLPAVVQPEFVKLLVGSMKPWLKPLLAGPKVGIGGADPEYDVIRSSRAYAEMAVLSLVPPRLLADHRPIIAALAEGSPGRVDLELIAKARAVEALPRIGKETPSLVWGDDLLRLAVLGALGDAECQRQLLDAFVKEKDPARKLNMVHYLGVLATKDALRAISEELRNPYEFSDEKRGLRRMRFEAVDALRISCPENRLCYTPLLKTDADWDALEKFCAREFGAAFTGPRPPPPKDFKIIHITSDGKVAPAEE